MAQNCEWMFADAGMGSLGFTEIATLNPLHWSGPIGFDICLQQLEEANKAVGNRPILVKIPAGFTTQEERFESVEAAVAHVKDNKRKQFQRRLEAAPADERQTILHFELSAKRKVCEDYANEVATSKSKEADVRTKLEDVINAAGKHIAHPCEWMFGDAGSGLGALGKRFSHYNPLRWSGSIAGETAIAQLEALVKHAVEHKENERPIVLKIPSGTSTQEHNFETTTAAITHLRTHIQNVDMELHSLQKAQLDAKHRLDDSKAKLADAKSELQEVEAMAMKEGLPLP